MSLSWLSLVRCINRELKKYRGLKSYFLSEGLSNKQFCRLSESFNDSMNEVYLFPLDNVFYKNCTFVDFEKRQSINFEQIVSIIGCFPILNAKFHNNPCQLDACLEELIFLGLTDKISSHAWNDAKVDVKPGKVFHCMDIIWDYLTERFSLLSSVALCVLTIPHSNANEEHVFSIIKKNKTIFACHSILKLH